MGYTFPRITFTHGKYSLKLNFVKIAAFCLFVIILIGNIVSSEINSISVEDKDSLELDEIENDLINEKIITLDNKHWLKSETAGQAILWENQTIIDSPLRPVTPVVVSDINGITHIIWANYLSGNGKIYHIMLDEYGTWSEKEEIYSQSQGVSIYCDAVTDDLGQIHLAFSWGETDLEQKIFYRKWSSGVWGAIERVDYGLDPFGNIIPANSPQIVVTSNGVPHIVWSSSLGSYFDNYYQPIFYQKRLGENIWSQMSFVGYSPPGTYRMTVTSDNKIHLVYVTGWVGSSRTYQEIYYTQKASDSLSFGLSTLLWADSIMGSYYSVPRPEILVLNNTIYVFFQALQESIEGIYGLYKLTNSWSEALKLTDVVAPYGRIKLAGIVTENEDIVLTWPKDDFDIGLQTGGLHYLSYLANNNTLTEQSLVTEEYANAIDPSITIDKFDRIHLVWRDEISASTKRLYYIQGKFDVDQDGIPDYDEINVYGTDPYNPDSDGDYMNDGDEIDYGMDPLNPDEDGDSMYDGWEVMNGLDFTNSADAGFDNDTDGLINLYEFTNQTNPFDDDTDNDLLIDGDEVLIYFTNPINNDTDGDLLHDGEEIITYFTDPLDNDTENDGMPDGFEVFYSLNPLVNDSYNDEDIDLLFNIEEYFIGTNPLKNDTDDDLLDDFEEYNIYQTNPLSNDTDEDLLTDYYEVIIDPLDDQYQTNNIYQTNPLEPDSDFDYLNDIIELDVSLTNPIDNDTDNDLMLDGYEWFFGLNPFFDDSTEDPDEDGLSNYIESTQFSNPYYDDTDFDRLSDYDEYQIGTSLTNSDTDGDGLTDYNEYVYFNTDPLDPDPDNDGLNDLLEVLVYGSGPYNNDSDGDTILDGDEVYIYFSNPVSQDSDRDGLKDQEEIAFNSSPILEDTDFDGMDDYFEWLYGFNPRFNDGQLDTDSDGLLNLEEYWLNGNPLIEDTDNDSLLDFEEAFIYLSALNRNDTDYDLLSDFEEVRTYGTSPSDPDSDDDGLSDGEEILIYGTNPLSFDTDGDGYSDYFEINSGTNPLNPNNNPGSNTKRIIISVFSSIVLVLILYYFVPYLFSRFSRNQESDWIEEGINNRKRKTTKLIQKNLDQIESKIPSKNSIDE